MSSLTFEKKYKEKFPNWIEDNIWERLRNYKSITGNDSFENYPDFLYAPLQLAEVGDVEWLIDHLIYSHTVMFFNSEIVFPKSMDKCIKQHLQETLKSAFKICETEAVIFFELAKEVKEPSYE